MKIHLFKFLCLLIFSLCSIHVQSQNSQKISIPKLKVSMDSLFKVQAFEGSEGLSERFTEQTAKALDSLHRKMGFEFYDNFRSEKKEKSHLILKGEIKYGSPPEKGSFPDKDYYMVFLSLIDSYKGELYDMVFLMGPEFEKFFNRGTDEAEIYTWALHDLSLMIPYIPLDKMLESTKNKGNLTRSIGLTYPTSLKPSPNTRLLEDIYLMMNNVLVSKQNASWAYDLQKLKYEFDYYPLYRNPGTEQTESTITASLEEEQDHYKLRFDIQGKDIILKSLRGGEPIPMEYNLSKQRLKEGNYLDIYDALDRTLESFINYNYQRQ